MAGDDGLVRQKVEQAFGILDELGIDCWLTFVRETTESGDPVLPIILGQELTWPSALIVTRSGAAIAIVGRYEDEAVRATGAYDEVVTYVEGVAAPLRETLARLDPGRIAINHSENDVKADGLTHGMHGLLVRHLAGTPYADRLESAEEVIASLRGRKLEAELARIESAIAMTDELYRAVTREIMPGMTERAVWAFLHERLEAAGAEPAWDPAQCPIVTTSPDSMVGHAYPSETLRVTAGGMLHLDFGVRRNGYCSDVQRVWWVPGDGAPLPPPPVERAFTAVREAIERARQALRPGAELWTVDAAARAAILEAGYAEYQHATGHQVGRAAHDGGGVIGPRWERYGRTPFRTAVPGEVYTLELGVDVPAFGYLGLEEMVVVTAGGCRPLTRFQDRPLVLGTAASRIC